MVGVKEISVNLSQEICFDSFDRNTNIARTSMYKMSPLHEFLWFEDIEGTEQHVKESDDLAKDLRTPDRDSRSPLIYAIISRQIPLVKLLLDAGAPVNYRTNDGYTALFYAVFYNAKEMVDLLLAKNAEVNVKSKGKIPVTPLQIACAKGHVQIVAKLLSAGAEVNPLYESNGETFNPLMLTLHSAEIEALAVREAICELLVGKDVSTSVTRSDGCTPLICAVNCGMSDFVRLLLEKDLGRVDKIAVDKYTTALWVAMYRKNVPVMNLLLEHDANIETGKTRSSPLHAAAMSQFAPGVKVLLDKGMPPMWLDQDGFTALHYAACLPNTECLELLLAKGINIEVQAKRSGFTPLIIACLKGNIPGIELLLKHSAKIEAYDKKDGLTPLIATIVNNQPEACAFLIKQGADIMARRGKTGMTPLMNAIGLNRDIIRDMITEKAKELGKVGEMRKQGGGHRSKAWKKRVFALYGTYFSYYKNQQQVNPQGIVILDKAKIEPSAKGKTAFQIVTIPRIYQIKADTEEIRNEWFEALTKAVESYKPEQPPALTFDFEGKIPNI